MTLEKTSAYRRILRLQVVFALLGSVGLVLVGQSGHVFALLYGMALMAANAWWLAHRLEKTRDLDVQAGQRSLYAGAALRFVALIVGLIVAHLIGLHLLAVASGMFLAQAVVFFAGLAELKKDRIDREQKGDGFG